ncbi:MAG: T9SS type A sorting domain-containing protein [Hymenobacteraceae bacterium]|nr:T9SS type A sorting domain-containing protein [Hymenobacteraceae bacterium]
MRALLLTLTALALGAGAARAQTQLTPRTFASGGGRGVGATVVLTYTLGQPCAASLANVGATFRLTQGFQQPGLTGGASARPALAVHATHAPGALTLDAWPNPTADYLHLMVRAMNGTPGLQALPEALTATLTDALGRAVLTQAVRPASGLLALDLRGLPTGAYLLQLADATGHRCATARVVRQ